MNAKGFVPILLTMALLPVVASRGVGAVPGAGSRKDSVSEKRLLAYCVANYRGLQLRGTNGYESGGYEAERKEDRAATRFFDTLSRQRLESRLVLLRKSLYRGTIAYTSVAYVLAYHGVDVNRNAERILYAFRAPETTPGSVLEAEKERYAPWCGDFFEAINRVYKRYPSDRILERVFHLSSDAEDWCDEQVVLFLRHPAAVLRVVNRIGQMEGFASGILPDYAGDYSRVHAGQTSKPDYRRVRAILGKMVRSSDRDVASNARKCRKLFEKTLRNPGAR